MRIDTKAKAALTALVEIAVSSTGRAVSLHDIAERHGMSVSYLEQLFGHMRTAGLVKSVRGPGGGYHIASPLAEITISEIVEAVDDEGAVRGTRLGGVCLGQSVWTTLNDKLLEHLSRITLAEVVAAERSA